MDERKNEKKQLIPLASFNTGFCLRVLAAGMKWIPSLFHRSPYKGKLNS